MKNLLLFVFVICLVNVSISQTEGVSPTYTFSIKKKVEPPILDFVAGTLKFKDSDGNNAINANEQCSIEFQLQNTGIGDGLNLKALVKAVGSNSGITIVPSIPLAVCGKGKTVAYSLPISSNMNTVDGKIEISIDIDEPNGFNPPIMKLEIDTKKFVAPAVAVVDHVLVSKDGSKTLELRKQITLQLLLQNTGQGIANDVRLKLLLPENVLSVSGDEIVVFGKLEPGETRSVEYEFILNSKFVGTNLNLTADVSESYGKYATDWNYNFTLNQPLASEKIVVNSKKEEGVSIQVASLRSDVDKDIPFGISRNVNKYALIIGNEDYSSKQNGLDKEVNVDYAENDARVFAEYCEKTLGIPKENITLLINATKGQMSFNISRLSKFGEIENGNAELLFYFSGHGLPEESTNVPYLIPVDVSGSTPAEGVSLSFLYDELSRYKTKKTTVILDACFSGGARNQSLVVVKGVKVKAKLDAVPGNLVVLASSSGNESSAVYRDKQHGYFTYFLLKNIQANKGNGTFDAIMSEVTQNVSREALRNEGKTQTPSVLPGTELGEGWKVLGW
jgi:hypothetical protein